ncbi:MAG: hypothetical protein RL375_3333 [Pseudomonadota bacterium]|jgi:hypothetical protein
MLLRGKTTGMFVGVALYIVEGAQSIALIPYFLRYMEATVVSQWLAMSSAIGLVALAQSAYYQPLIREVSRAVERGESIGRGAWSGARMRALVSGGMVLLFGWLLLLIYLLNDRTYETQELILPAGIYLVGLFFRLATFIEFAPLIGQGYIGTDKLLLLVASASVLVLYLVIVPFRPTMLAMVWAYLLVNIVLYGVTRLVTAKVLSIDPRRSPGLTLPTLRESFGLVLLNVGGYLNLGTDAIVSARLLPADQSVAYVLWSKIFMTQIALVGMWSQLRFPAWSREGIAISDMHQELRQVLTGMAIYTGCLSSFYLLSRQFHIESLQAVLGVDSVLVMLLTTNLACVALVVGQMLTARHRYTFVPLSIVSASASPFLAVQLGSLLGHPSFILGYLIGNALLVTVAVVHLRREKLVTAP